MQTRILWRTALLSVVVFGTPLSADWETGVQLFEAEDFEAAFDELAEVERRDSRYAAARHLMGACLIALDRPVEALEVLREAKREEPENIVYALTFVQAQLLAREPEAEVRLSLEEIELAGADERSRERYIALLSVYAKEHEADQEVLQILTDKVDVNDASPQLVEALGRAHLSGGQAQLAYWMLMRYYSRHAEALSVGQLAVTAAIQEATQSTSPDAWRQRAAVLAERLTANDSTFDSHLLATRTALAVPSMKLQAERHFALAVEKVDNDPARLFELGRLAWRRGDRPAAHALLAWALELGPTEVDRHQIHELLGQFNQEVGFPQLARVHFRLAGFELRGESTASGVACAPPPPWIEAWWLREKAVLEAAGVGIPLWEMTIADVLAACRREQANEREAAWEKLARRQPGSFIPIHEGSGKDGGESIWDQLARRQPGSFLPIRSSQ